MQHHLIQMETNLHYSLFRWTSFSSFVSFEYFVRKSAAEILGEMNHTSTRECVQDISYARHKMMLKLFHPVLFLFFQEIGKINPTFDSSVWNQLYNLCLYASSYTVLHAFGLRFDSGVLSGMQQEISTDTQTCFCRRLLYTHSLAIEY